MAAQKTSAGLVAHAHRALGEGWGYVWGTYGNLLTAALMERKAAQYPAYNGGANRDQIWARWAGKTVSDCVGLIKGYKMWDDAQDKPVYDPVYDINVSMLYNQATQKGPLATIPEIPGVCVQKPGHVGVYIGDGQVIECAGGRGAIQTPLRGAGATPWVSWLKVPFLQYPEPPAHTGAEAAIGFIKGILEGYGAR